MTMRPCLTCGVPSDGTRCEEHRRADELARKGSARARGYSAAWDKLSRRARKAQPFCSDCGATTDLQLDHAERTWQRAEAGKLVRLSDTGGVVCGPCNRARGAARGRLALGEEAALGGPGLRREAGSRLLTGNIASVGSNPAGTGAEPPVSASGDRLSTDGAGPALSEQVLQPSTEEPDVRLSRPQGADPLREHVAVQVVDAAQRLDRDHRVVSNVCEVDDPVHRFVRVPQRRLPHVTTIPVTEDAS